MKEVRLLPVLSFTCLWFIVAAVLFWLSGCQTDNKNSPLNVILITVDDLGWRDLGCYGSTYYETPNIDRLASRSFVFSQAYAAAAICSPSRAAIMTGMYPARLGLTDWIRARFQGGSIENVIGYDTLETKPLLTPKNPFHLPVIPKTLAGELKSSGYVTAHIGKWHLGAEHYGPENMGFDYNVAGCDYGQPPSYFDPYEWRPEGEGQQAVLGFPTMKARKKGEYLTDREAWEAAAFLRKHKSDPFFLHLNHYAVHTPIQAKEEIIAGYVEKQDRQGSPEYAAMIHSVDEALGTLVHVLDSLRLTDQTMILFTSDNGGLKGERFTDNSPLRSGKGYPYEGGIRVPLIIYHPAIKPSRTIEEPVIGMDLFATIAASCGLSDEQMDKVDGENLLPLLSSEDPLERHRLVWHFPHYRGSDVVPYSILRSKDWKLIKYYGIEDNFELFNLAQDPSEKFNLSTELPDLLAEMEASLDVMLTNMNAKLPIIKSEPF